MTKSSAESTTTVWDSLDLSGAPADGPVAFHDDLDPRTLLEAYRHGMYSFPAETAEQHLMREVTYEPDVAAGRVRVLGDAGNPYAVAWCSPDPRPLVFTEGARVRRSTRQRLRRMEWTTTVDICFERVVEHCRAGREPQWLTDRLVAAMCLLHESGHAHSVEVWDGDDLVGGTFGVRAGGIFSADSQFTGRSGAAEVAVADLVRRLAESGGVAVDVQNDGEYPRLLGARPVPRTRYLDLLRTHADRDGPLPADPLPARRLAD
jgi:leucyl/phenylalanyl-tRNA---protein transferase